MTAPPESSPPSRTAAGWLGLVARVAATVGLMAWAVRGADEGQGWGRILALMAAANWPWWVAALTVTLAGQVVAGIRWAALARPLGFDFPRRFFVRRFFEGMFFSLCLPSSIGGDVVKAVRIGGSTPLRLLAACSVLVDRLTGLAALGVLVGTAMLSRRHALPTPATAAVFAALCGAAMLGFGLGLVLLGRLHAALPASSRAAGFTGRLLPYRRRPSLVILAVAWSFVVQLSGVVAVALVARAVGVVQPALVWLSVVPLVNLAMVLPISIGGFGVRENLMEFLLREHGVPSETGIAIALLWGLCTVVAGIVGGLFFLWEREPRSVRRATPVVGGQ